MNHELIQPVIQQISADLKNEMIISRVNYQTNSVTILLINNSLRDKDLKPLRKFIADNDLMMMVNYNMLYCETISITLLKKQSYAIHPIN
jgi:hypothetical protein